MLTIEGRNARDVAERSHATEGQIFGHTVAGGVTTGTPAAHFEL
jgi:hypothetical protein